MMYVYFGFLGDVIFGLGSLWYECVWSWFVSGYLIFVVFIGGVMMFYCRCCNIYFLLCLDFFVIYMIIFFWFI